MLILTNNIADHIADFEGEWSGIFLALMFAMEHPFSYKYVNFVMRTKFYVSLVLLKQVRPQILLVFQ